MKRLFKFYLVVFSFVLLFPALSFSFLDLRTTLGFTSIDTESGNNHTLYYGLVGNFTVAFNVWNGLHLGLKASLKKVKITAPYSKTMRQSSGLGDVGGRSDSTTYLSTYFIVEYVYRNFFVNLGAGIALDLSPEGVTFAGTGEFGYKFFVTENFYMPLSLGIEVAGLDKTIVVGDFIYNPSINLGLGYKFNL